MKLGRLILYLGAVVFLGWLFWQNLEPAPSLVLHYKPGDPASPISALYPADRTIDLPENGANQVFYRDPVYFDVLVPPKIKNIAIMIAWQNQVAPIVNLGARKSEANWLYTWRTLEENNNSGPAWQRKTVTWDRSDFFIANNRVNFFLSVPGLEQKYGSVVVSDITATVQREPFGVSDLVVYAKSIIGLK